MSSMCLEGRGHWVDFNQFALYPGLLLKVVGSFYLKEVLRQQNLVIQSQTSQKSKKIEAGFSVSIFPQKEKLRMTRLPIIFMLFFKELF